MMKHYSIYLVTGNLKKRNRNPIKKQTERCVQITNNHREYSFKEIEVIQKRKG